jgi:hypothetical protein
MSLVTSKCLILISKGYIIQNDISEVKNMSSKDKKSLNEKKRNTAEKLEGQEFVDQIPLEDLKIEMEDERKKFKTKDDSQSERKYKRNYDK